MKRQEKKKPRREVSDRAASFQFFLFFIFLFRPTMSRQWVKDAHASSSASSTRSSVTSFSSSSSSPFFHVRLPALILSGAVHCDPRRFFLRWFFFFSSRFTCVFVNRWFHYALWPRTPCVPLLFEDGILGS